MTSFSKFKFPDSYKEGLRKIYIELIVQAILHCLKKGATKIHNLVFGKPVDGSNNSDPKGESDSGRSSVPCVVVPYNDEVAMVIYNDKGLTVCGGNINLPEPSHYIEVSNLTTVKKYDKNAPMDSPMEACVRTSIDKHANAFNISNCHCWPINTKKNQCGDDSDDKFLMCVCPDVGVAGSSNCREEFGRSVKMSKCNVVEPNQYEGGLFADKPTNQCGVNKPTSMEAGLKKLKNQCGVNKPTSMEAGLNAEKPTNQCGVNKPRSMEAGLNAEKPTNQCGVNKPRSMGAGLNAEKPTNQCGVNKPRSMEWAQC